MVRGFHVYREIWEASEGEVLPCTREVNNLHYPFSVAVKKDSIIVGHVPRKVSAICSLFLKRGGSIMCRVTGSKRYSADLPQGGLEIPAILTFTGDPTRVEKIKNRQ